MLDHSQIDLKYYIEEKNEFSEYLNSTFSSPQQIKPKSHLLHKLRIHNSLSHCHDRNLFFSFSLATFSAHQPADPAPVDRET